MSIGFDRGNIGWPTRTLLAALGISGMLVTSACGPDTDLAVDNAPAEQTAQSTPPPEQLFEAGIVDDEMKKKFGNPPPCPPDSNRTSCVYGTNEAHVFTGPNQVGPATYSLSKEQFHTGEEKIPPPTSWTPSSPAVGTMLAKYYSGGWGTGNDTEFWYAPSAGMPASDLVYFHVDNPFVGSHSMTCNAPEYTTVTCSTDNGTDANFFVDIVNFPLTVAVVNNLPTASDKLTLSGDPGFDGMRSDSVGTSGQASVDPGNTGYFGMYMQRGKTDVFSARYSLPGDSPDLAGTTVNINASITVAGTLDKASSCQVSLGSTSQQAYCDMAIIGGSGPNTLTVNIHQ